MTNYPNIAVIDLGTNTFHLLVAKVFEKRFQVLYREKVPVKIGEGGIDDNVIIPEAKNRAIKTLKKYRKIIDEYKVESVTALATSAFRNASNSDEVREEVLKETGIDIHIIDGMQEARLIYEGVKHSLKLPSDNSVIMDIGGGSVEFIICNDQEVFWEHSFEIGGQRLMNKFHVHDPISEEDKAGVSSFLEEKLELLKNACAEFKPKNLIGASGSFDTIIDIFQHKKGIVEYLDSHEIDQHELKGIIDDLVSKDHSQRMMVPGMIEMRADMIVVAGLLIKHICGMNSFEKIFTSRFALKEGVLFASREHQTELL